MSDTTTQLHPDPKACAVARAVCDVVHPNTVILFGSRARGDFTPDSDIDLLIITDAQQIDRQEYMRTSEAARRGKRNRRNHHRPHSDTEQNDRIEK